jgi:hypothetical protein
VSAAKLREQAELIDRQRGQVSTMRARHARELAELVARHTLEERDQERTHRRELARLWIGQGRAMGRWILDVLEAHQAAAAALDPEGGW